MKAPFLMRLVAVSLFLLMGVALAYGQGFPASEPDVGSPPPAPDQARGDFQSATQFPGTMGSADLPALPNPQEFDTMPESGTGTGTGSTLGGSGTGSGGLGLSTDGPYTSSPLGSPNR